MKFQLHISGYHGMLLYFYQETHPRYSDSDTLVFSPASFDNIAQQQQLCAVVWLPRRNCSRGLAECKK